MAQDLWKKFIYPEKLITYLPLDLEYQPKNLALKMHLCNYETIYRDRCYLLRDARKIVRKIAGEQDILSVRTSSHM